MQDVDPDFVITKIGWKFVGSLETPEQERARFSALAEFLDDHGLSTHPLRRTDGSVPGDFTLRRRDLTEEGFRLLRSAMPRWLKAVDRSKNPKNVGILSRELAKLRSAPPN